MCGHPSINMLGLGNKQGIRFKGKGIGMGSLHRERLWSGHHHRGTVVGDTGVELQPTTLTLNSVLRKLCGE